LEKLKLGVVDVLIAFIALVPWRTALVITLQLSIILRTFDAYLKWALPILFIAGPVFAYLRDRRAARFELTFGPRMRARAAREARFGRSAVRRKVDGRSKVDVLRGVGVR
jgi:hypothetical protein